jgi:DMSO reductase family type II enzyme chaperone
MAEPQPSTTWDQVDLYRMFAYLFGPPTPDRLDRLRSPSFAQSLAQLGAALGCSDPLSRPGSFPDLSRYESAYIALFDVGLPEPPVPLQESAHNKAFPPQQIALENVSFYEVLGLKVDPSRQAPDHLVTQLEFLAAVRYAREKGPADGSESLRRLERDFLQRHLLSWFPEAAEKLRRLGPPVFPALAALLAAFLRRRLAALEGDGFA